MKQIKRLVRQLLLCLACAAVLSGLLSVPPAVRATPFGPTTAHAATANSKAIAAYKKQVKKLARLSKYSDGACYKWVNIYGNSTVDLLCVTKESGGSAMTLRIYTYANGKVKLLLKTSFYGDNSYSFYRGSNGFVMYCSGHGGEHYDYYKASGGKYRLVARKGRTSRYGGAAVNGAWCYFGSSGKISKATFNARVKPIQKGSPVKVKASWKWSLMKR